MLTRHHVLLGLLCCLIPASAIAESDPALAILILAGCLTGLILPDVHMKRPRTNKLLAIPWGIVQLGKWICLPVMCLLYRRLLKIGCEPGDKRLTHSIPGCFFCFFIFSALAYVLHLVFRNDIPALAVVGFLAGLLTGLLLHLAEDLCTRKGITPFYPWNETKIVGSIRPCDVFDNRIFRFHVYHSAVLFFFLIFVYAGPWPVSGMIASSLAGVVICIVSMVYCSNVRIEHPRNTRPDTVDVIAA
jgi:membrane-bound metal-dependent hydrolase YbcI (DUF457 family)